MKLKSRREEDEMGGQKEKERESRLSTLYANTHLHTYILTLTMQCISEGNILMSSKISGASMKRNKFT